MAHSDTSITESQLPSAEPVSWLVYGFDFPGGVVFQTVEQAIFDDTVHDALAEAKTWGEFRRFLPEGEWETIEESLLESWDYDEDDPDRLHWEVDNTPFDASAIPGYDDDAYPRWVQQSIDEVIQGVLLEVHGVQETSIPFRLGDPDQAAVVTYLLSPLGYHVEHTQFLRGWWSR